MNSTATMIAGAPLIGSVKKQITAPLNAASQSVPVTDKTEFDTEAMLRAVVDTMEQGIIVWSASAKCLMTNERVFTVLELEDEDLFLGCGRDLFLQKAANRGEIAQENIAAIEKEFSLGKPFAFDRSLPSGRIVATNARPLENGGHVVTFTDVSMAKRNERELSQAKINAEEAESIARKTLEVEKSRKQESRLLADLGEWLQSCKSLEEVFKVISQFMAKLLPGTSGELFIYSNSRDVLDSACSWNHTSDLGHIHADECWALRRGRMYKYGFGVVDFACGHVEQSSQGQDQPDDNYLCIPIVAHGDTVGLLHIRFLAKEIESQAHQQQKFSANNKKIQAFALRCSEQISLAIANVKLRDELRDQSTKDPLTGLYNRRYFLDACRRDITHAERNDQSIGMISFDADNFKTFNDNHGHDAGDIVLRAIADVMHNMFCNGETPCRFGGEEFTILVPDSSLEQTAKMAEMLRSKIEKLVIRYRENELPRITISIGVATYPEFGRLPQDVLNSADDALYRAKAAGKNQVCTAVHNDRKRGKESDDL